MAIAISNIHYLANFDTNIPTQAQVSRVIFGLNIPTQVS